MLNDNSSIFIFGPRGVGKSRLIKEALKDLPNKNTLVIDLLNTTEFREFLKKPELLYEQLKSRIQAKEKTLVVVDEIQKSLGTKVRLVRNTKKPGQGRILIEFYSDEELKEIHSRLTA